MTLIRKKETTGKYQVAGGGYGGYISESSLQQPYGGGQSSEWQGGQLGRGVGIHASVYKSPKTGCGTVGNNGNTLSGK